MHTHEWSRSSSHTTSEGQVVYVRCSCGAHRVELVPRSSPATVLAVAAGDGAAGLSRSWH